MAMNFDPPKIWKKAGCAELLQDKEKVTHGGYINLLTKFKHLRVINMLAWSNKYAVIHNGCLYIFKDGNAKKASVAVSLYGYNKVLRESDPKIVGTATNAFMLEPVQDMMKTFYFYVPSEKERGEWMVKLKHAMLYANGKVFSLMSRTSIDSISLGSVEESIYNDTDEFEDVNKQRPVPDIVGGHPGASGGVKRRGYDHSGSDSDDSSYTNIEDEFIDPPEDIRSRFNDDTRGDVSLPPRPPKGRDASSEKPSPQERSLPERPPPERPPLERPPQARPPLERPQPARPPPERPQPARPPPERPAPDPVATMPTVRPSPAPKPTDTVENMRQGGIVQQSANLFGGMKEKRLPGMMPQQLPGMRSSGDHTPPPLPQTPRPSMTLTSSLDESPASPSSPSGFVQPDYMEPRVSDIHEEEEMFTWCEVYWPDIDRQGATYASTILCDKAQEGVFLVRDGSKPGEYTLCVYAESAARKFKISYNHQSQKYFIKAGIELPSILELLSYYCLNAIPVRPNSRLITPYSMC